MPLAETSSVLTGGGFPGSVRSTDPCMVGVYWVSGRVEITALDTMAVIAIGGQLRLLLPSLAEFSIGILGSWQMEGRVSGPPHSKLAGMHPLPQKRGPDASSHTLGVVHCVDSQRDLEKRGLMSDSDF